MTVDSCPRLADKLSGRQDAPGKVTVVGVPGRNDVMVSTFEIVRVVTSPDIVAVV